MEVVMYRNKKKCAGASSRMNHTFLCAVTDTPPAATPEKLGKLHACRFFNSTMALQVPASVWSHPSSGSSSFRWLLLSPFSPTKRGLRHLVLLCYIVFILPTISPL
ncbi:hypothetical protein TNCV_4098301 [Trichonephila clavipes]|nr:hypothetical protein TNCV_4098301 [Trichonephila clavipes]